MPSTLYDKIFDAHIVKNLGNGNYLLYIDRHLVHEVTSPQAFEGLRAANRKIRQTKRTLAVADHNVSTHKNRLDGVEIEDDSKTQLTAMKNNTSEFGVEFYAMDNIKQGIVHIVGPEQGFTLPATTVVCGDSHTSTHGAFGALAFGIGTSEVEHVLATQTLEQKKYKNFKIEVNGDLPIGVTAKDVVLYIIGQIGAAGGTGYVIEYCGTTIESLSIEGRMTICNMSIEAGAKAGLIAPDKKTFEYFKSKEKAPKGENWAKAVDYWQSLYSDSNAKFDRELIIDTKDIEPQVTWGTSPEDVAPVSSFVPNPDSFDSKSKASAVKDSLQYMGLNPNQKISDISIDRVFIGSCTNGRIEDLREVAKVVKGKKVANSVNAMIVPGSGLVKENAEQEGLHEIFIDAGFEWREPGCSMCLAMNADKLTDGERCASTSNRNFKGRQGKGGRTHLMSPAMAARAAIEGKITDCRY